MIKRKITEPLREWILPCVHTEDDNRAVKKIAEKLNISIISAGLLYDRGCTDADDAEKFIETTPDCGGFCDPFMMSSMKEACERIELGIERGEKTVVYGDYDVDGVTSVSTLVRYLRDAGLKDVGYYIPSRTGEGYGLGKQSLEKLSRDKYTLMITVDTGITAVEEIEYAKALGIDTVVTDHHEYRRNPENGEMELPKAPCLNPRRSDCKYSFKELAGVGVVFRLICAPEMRRSGIDAETAAKVIIESYSELIAVGTVADVMPLYGENRNIVKAGLKALENPRFEGTRKLLSLCTGYDFNEKGKKRLTTSLISFNLAPRINAVGRMGSASTAAELFITDDPVRAGIIAGELCSMNTLRQQEENRILNSALEKIEKSIKPDDAVIVLDDDSWHHGVIGIVASRLTEKYALPSILISFDGNAGEKSDEHDIGKGSGRSVKGLNLVDALEACRDKLVKFGGHELAAGLTIERGKLAEFRTAINEYAKKIKSNEPAVLKMRADAVIKSSDVNVTLANELLMLEPFGQSNPKPQFIMENMTVSEVIPLKEGKHIKLMLESDGRVVTALYFGMPYGEFDFALGDTADILGQIEQNEFMGRTEAQVHIKDMKHPHEVMRKREEEMSVYNSALHGGDYPAQLIPEREDFALVYSFLRKSTGSSDIAAGYNLYNLCARINPRIKFPYIKLRAVLDIMNELSLIKYICDGGIRAEISVNRAVGKINLDDSELLRSLRRRAKKPGE